MEHIEKSKIGLNDTNRNLLVAICFIVLLIWGPIEQFGLFVRIAYVILIPLVMWIGLSYFGKSWNVDRNYNERITRGISGIIAGVLFAMAFASLTSTYHTECTNYIKTHDGRECVGDYVSVPGRDYGSALTQTFIAGIATWYSISKHHKDNSS